MSVNLIKLHLPFQYINKSVLLILILVIGIIPTTLVYASPSLNITDNVGQSTPPMSIYDSSNNMIFRVLSNGQIIVEKNIQFDSTGLGALRNYQLFDSSGKIPLLNTTNVFTATNTFNSLSLGGTMSLVGNTLSQNGHIITVPSNTGTICLTNQTTSCGTAAIGTIMAATSPSNFIVFVNGSNYQVNNATSGLKVHSSTNATAEIQYAINNLPSGKGKVLIKSGNYPLTAPITIGSQLMILEGDMPTLQANAAVVSPMIKMVDSSQRSGIQIRNLILQNTGASGSGTGLDMSHFAASKAENIWLTGNFHTGILINSTDAFYNTIENVRVGITGPNSTGIYIGNGANDNTVIRTRILTDGNATGIYINAHANNLISNDVESGAKYGLDVGPLGNDLDVSNIYLELNKVNVRLQAGVVGTVFDGGTIIDATVANIVDNGANRPVYSGTTIQYAATFDLGGNNILRTGPVQFNQSSTQPSGSTLYIRGTSNTPSRMDFNVPSGSEFDFSANHVIAVAYSASRMNFEKHDVVGVLDIQSAANTIASTGVMRLGNMENLTWASNPAGSSVSLRVDTNNNFVFGKNATSIDANTHKIINLSNATLKNDAVNARQLGLLGNMTTGSKCSDNQVLAYQISNQTWICSSITSDTDNFLVSLNGDTTAAQKIIRGNSNSTTITNSTGTVTIGLKPDVILTNGSAQTITKPLTFTATSKFQGSLVGGNLNYPASYIVYPNGSNTSVRDQFNNIVFTGTARTAISWGINITGSDSVYIGNGTYDLDSSFGGFTFGSANAYDCLILDPGAVIRVPTNYTGYFFKFDRGSHNDCVIGNGIGKITEKGTPGLKWTAFIIQAGSTNTTGGTFNNHIENLQVQNPHVFILFNGSNNNRLAREYANDNIISGNYIGNFIRCVDFNYTEDQLPPNQGQGFNHNGFVDNTFQSGTKSNGACLNGIIHDRTYFSNNQIWDVIAGQKSFITNVNATGTEFIGGNLDKNTHVDNEADTIYCTEVSTATNPCGSALGSTGFVTITGIQTITGQKTFNADPIFEGNSAVAPLRIATHGSNPTLQTKGDVWINGILLRYRDNSNNTQTVAVLGNTQTFTSKQTFSQANSQSSINIDTRASGPTLQTTGDIWINGSTISYRDNSNATQVLSPVSGGGFVTLTGPQTISGQKTFSGDPIFDAGGAVAPLRLGTAGSNPTLQTKGDVWINGVLLRYRDNSNNTETVAILGNAQTFTSKNTFTTSATTAPINLGDRAGDISQPRQGDIRIIGANILIQDHSNRTETLLNINGSAASLTNNVRGITSGTAISVNGSTGTVQVTNTGVTSATGTANNVTVSASSGAVTWNLGSNVVVTNGKNQTITKWINFTSGTVLQLLNVSASSTPSRASLNIGCPVNQPTTTFFGDIWCTNGGVLRYKASGTTFVLSALSSAETFSGAKTFTAANQVTTGSFSWTNSTLIHRGNGHGLAESSQSQSANNTAIWRSTGSQTNSYISYVGSANFTTPSNPSSTTSTTGVMTGLLASMVPKYADNMTITVSGDMANSALADGVKIDLRYQTTNCSPNAVAVTGTTVGNPLQVTAVNANADGFPFSITGYVTGLTAGTKYCIELGQYAVTAGTASITNLSVFVRENS